MTPIRLCRATYTCHVCGGRIKWGELYYDGGAGKRWHVECEKKEQAEVDAAGNRQRYWSQPNDRIHGLQADSGRPRARCR